MSADMWGGSSSDEDEVQKPRASGVRINKAFEARYNERNRREELLNVRKGRSDLLAESSDESTSEEEDEEGNLLTANVEATVARTLAMIRNRDPKIYQPDFKVNYGVKADAQQNKSKTDKPMYVKDYARYKHADDLASDSLDTSKTTHDDEAAAPGQRLTYNQEQADLKKELQAATAAAADDSDEDDDGGAGLFTVKRVLKPDGSKAAESATVAESDAPVSKDEAFLENYISQRKWAEADPEDFVPSYKEIIEEVKEYEKAEEYEKKYNFRYEEAGGTEIVGHSRKVEGSLRRSKDKRKLAREEKRRRKAEEKARRAEELKRLKNLKRKEIAKKLSQIQELAGSKDLVSKLTKHADEIDDEFDPDAHDKMMRKIFDEEYYSDDEEEDADAVGAAVRPDDTEAGDTETDNTSQNGEAQPKKKKELPSHVQEILDEEFKLDFEDVVGGLPTRFKYKKVEANDYGLTAEEILNATDAELRQYVSTKKIQPHGDREWKVPSSKRRAFRKNLQKRLKEEKEAEAAEARTLQKQQNRKRKKSRKSAVRDSHNPTKKNKKSVETPSVADVAEPAEKDDDNVVSAEGDSSRNKSKKRRKKSKHSKRPPQSGGLSKSRLAAYGL